MSTLLEWRGPFSFTTGGGQPLLTSPEGAKAGLYFWAIRTVAGLLPHYVGETGGSFAGRHLEHFHAYATGVYSTRDADALLRGEDVLLRDGLLWRKRTPSASQSYVDGFAEYARHTARLLDHIAIYIAPIEVDLRTRRRLEGGLVSAFYAAPEPLRRLFPAGYRVRRRAPTEAPLIVRSENPPAVSGFPVQVEA